MKKKMTMRSLSGLPTLPKTKMRSNTLKERYLMRTNSVLGIAKTFEFYLRTKRISSTNL